MYKLLGFTLSLLPLPVLAASGDYGLGEARGNLPAGRTAGTFAEKLSGALGTLIGSLLAFLGVIMLVLMIYGGLTWMLSRGDSKKVDTAKGTISSAIIGLIIIMAAYVLTAYLGDNVLSLI
jgi:cbb3-type cytochrome oxidase subunit 3